MVFPFTYQVGVIKNPLKHPSDPQLPAPKIHPESQIYSIAGAAIGFMAQKMAANSHKNHPVQFPNHSDYCGSRIMGRNQLTESFT